MARRLEEDSNVDVRRLAARAITDTVQMREQQHAKQRELAKQWAEEDKQIFDTCYKEQLRAWKPYTQEQNEDHTNVVEFITGEFAEVESPWMIFMAGGPGSGKGYVIRWLKEHMVIPHIAAHIDFERHRTGLRTWKEDKGKVKSKATVAASQVEAGWIGELAAISCAVCGKSFVYDGTFRNSAWNLRFMKRLQSIVRRNASV